MYLKLAVNVSLVSGLAGLILAKEDNGMASWIRGNAKSKTPPPEAIAAVRKLSENLAFLEEIMADGVGEDHVGHHEPLDAYYDGEDAFHDLDHDDPPAHGVALDTNKFNYHWDKLIYGLIGVLSHIENGFCAIGNCLHELGPLDTGDVNGDGDLNHTHTFKLPVHDHNFTVQDHKHNFDLPNHTHPITELNCTCTSECTQVCDCMETGTGKPTMVDTGTTGMGGGHNGTTNPSGDVDGTTGSSGSLDHTHDLEDLQHELNDCGHHTLDEFNAAQCMHNMTNHTGLGHTHLTCDEGYEQQKDDCVCIARPAYACTGTELNCVELNDPGLAYTKIEVQVLIDIVSIGLEGEVVKLLDSNACEIATVTTDADGVGSFDVDPGNYKVFINIGSVSPQSVRVSRTGDTVSVTVFVF